MSTDNLPEPEANRQYGAESLLFAPDKGQTWTEWIGCVLFLTTFAIAGGPWGGLAGIAAIAVWFSLGTPYALATGVLLLMALTSNDIGSFSTLIIGLGLVALVLVPTVNATVPRAYAITVVAATVTLGGLTWVLLQSQPVWITALLLLTAIAVSTYGLYRYQRLRLGLLDESTPPARKKSGESLAANSDQP